MADGPGSPAGGSHESGGEQSPQSNSNIREQGRFLPIANISRTMKKALPANGKVAKDAKDTVQECVSEFISFVTSEARDKCLKEKRKTINGDDLLWAMATLGFEDFIDPLKAYLSRYREIIRTKKSQNTLIYASKAIDILEAYEGTLEDDYPPESERCEHGEMLLYKISLLEECGLFEKALKELRKKEFKIVDKLSYKEEEVSLLVKLNSFEEGEKLYRVLLTMNPDNYKYYEGLQKCVGLHSKTGQYSSDEIDKLDALYKSLGEQYTWSSTVKRIPLDFLDAEKFRDAADNYIRPLLTKGVPSLFSDLSPLYDHPGKANILEKLVLGLEESLEKTGGYPGRSEKEPPSTLMWTLFYLAQHYDRRGQYDVALAKIEEAMQHTPTVIDLYSVKSKIQKHAGDFAAASALADEARCMDLADRYVNSQCVKRMLQADQVSLAEKTAVLFTKDGDQHNNLHDMQCMWYELASAENYFRQNDLGRALKKFLAVEKHYADITEDQFDFHSYCLRKMTLRAYIEMLRFQDRLHAHAYFRKAAAGAIRTI